MPPRPVKVTIKSVVLDGIRAGRSIDDVANDIVEKFPGSKGAEDPVRYVKFYMSQAGISGKQKERVETERKKNENKGFYRAPWPPPNMNEVLETVIIGSSIFKIYRGLIRTAKEAMKTSRRDLYTAFKELTGMHANPEASEYSVRVAVAGEIQNRWYAATGQPLPPKVEAYQAQRLEDVKMGKKKEVTEAAETEARVTVKSVITSGLLGGKSDEDIAAELQEMFPGKKAAENPSQHISYYRSALVKSGELEKQPRKSRKAADAEVEAAPAKGKGKAKPAAKTAAKKTARRAKAE